MAKARRGAPRRYTLDEKIALVTEIERRYSAGDVTLKAAANAAGTTDTSYLNWVRAGVRPAVVEVPAPAPKVVSSSVRRFEQGERARLTAAVGARRAAGESVRAACKAEGVGEKSYRRWVEDARPVPLMRPVEVTALVPVAPALPAAFTLAPPRPAAEPALLTLVAPGGYRIEGLAIEAAAALLRALA